MKNRRPTGDIAPSTGAVNHVPIADYAAWYEHDPVARIVTTPSAEVLAMNAEARHLASDRCITIDSDRRLRFPRPLHAIDDPIKHAFLGFESRHNFYLASGHVLAVAVSPATIGQTILHISALRVELEQSINLECLIEDFGIASDEVPVLDGLTRAASAKDMATSLGLSIYAVRSLLQSIYSKLGVRSAAAAQDLILQTYFAFELFP